MFQGQHLRHFGATLRKADEPVALRENDSLGNWGRSGEPDRLSRHDFLEDRQSRLVRRALQNERISLGRGAEILDLSREQMRQRIREWDVVSAAVAARAGRSPVRSAAGFPLG